MSDAASHELIHRQFLRNLGEQARWASLLIGVSIVGGALGFHALARLSWVDALLNACMLLGGMGPVGSLGSLDHTPTSGKLFAAGYALYSGLVFLIVAGLLVTPVFHRVLHKFHLEGGQGEK
jgi:hypothetical protein